jgi:hypothetical protein
LICGGICPKNRISHAFDRLRAIGDRSAISADAEQGISLGIHWEQYPQTKRLRMSYYVEVKRIPIPAQRIKGGAIAAI